MDISELVAVAQQAVDKGRTPAAQLAIARHGELLAFESLGEATPATRFAIYSATKPIVASAVWLLIGDGLLDVSRPVADLIPEFGTNGKDAITVEQVMLHTAGIPNGSMTFVEGADPARRVDRFAEWSLEWDPGSRFEYHATSAHWVLAELLHRLGGMDFRDYIEQRVCAPLGLPRVLGLAPDDDADLAMPSPIGDITDHEMDFITRVMSPEGRASGVPGGGGIMTAAQLALFYQALLHNPGELWSPAVLDDAKTNIRNTFPDPLMGAKANRSLGLVLAGDDGEHILRYACFGEACSPGSFGHAGAHAQVAWADPATGISFAYVHNGVDANQMREGARSVQLACVAAQLGVELAA